SRRLLKQSLRQTRGPLKSTSGDRILPPLYTKLAQGCQLGVPKLNGYQRRSVGDPISGIVANNAPRIRGDSRDVSRHRRLPAGTFLPDQRVAQLGVSAKRPGSAASCGGGEV